MNRPCRTIALLLFGLALAGSARAQSDWSVNASSFEFSMSMVVQVPGSSSSGDRVAAFVGNTIRGVAAPTTVGGEHLFFLTVYANTTGEEVTFRYADAIAGTVTTPPNTASFVSNAVIGTVSDPFQLSARDAAGDTTPPPAEWQVNAADYSATMSVVASVVLPDGLDVAPEDRLAALAGSTVRGVSEPTTVSGQDRFFLTVHGNTAGTAIAYRYFDASTETVHDIPETDVFTMNAVLGSIAAPRTLTTPDGAGAGGGSGSGAPDWTVNPAAFQHSMSIVARTPGSTGAGDLLAVFDGSDIRGVVGPTTVGSEQLFFLTAYGNTPSATLSAKWYRAGSDETQDLTPTLDFQPDDVLGTVSAPVVFDGENTIPDDAGAWQVTPSAFERTMSVVAAFRVDGTPVSDAGDRLAAFVDGELRGVADATAAGGAGSHLFFLTVYANTDGEQLTFRGYDAAADEIRLLDGSLAFASNGVEGTVSSPLTLDARWPETCVPDVSIAGADVQTVASGSPVLLSVAAGLPACATASPALTLLWEQVSGPSLTLSGADRASIEVPAGDLEPGSTYVFRATATTAEAPIRAASDLVTVTVQRAPLQVLIDGGDRTVGDAAAFTLDASASNDPDDGSALTGFSWTCEAVPSGTACLQGQLATTATISVPAGALDEGTYRFEVTGTKDARAGTASVDITVEGGSVPQVSISRAQPGVPVVVSNRLELAGSVTTDVPGTPSWSWSVTGLDLTDPSISSSGPSASTLVLEPGVLTGGQTYSVTLTVQDGQGGTGSAQLELETDGRPSGGTLSVSPVEGTALTTPFVLNAQGWTDSEGAVSYQFFIRRPDDSLIPLTNLMAGSSAQVVLPAGSAAGDVLTVVLRVVDGQGQAAETTVPVTVHPIGSVQDLVLTSNAPGGGGSDQGSPRIPLEGDLPVSGTLELDGLDLDLNGYTLELGPNGTLNESGGNVTGDGTVRTERTLNGPADQNIGGIGLGLTSGSDLGTTRIERRHGPVVLPDGSLSIRRQFDIEPATQPSDGITITIHFTAADLSGHDPTTLTCFVFDTDAGQWTSDGVTVVARTASSVTCQAPHLSEWTLGAPGANAALTLNARVFLEGPLNAGGTAMSTSLGAAIPATQPYGGAHFAGTALAYSGSETAGSIPANVVDWILVELRQGGSAVATQAAFVLNDGRVVHTDGSSRLTFNGLSSGDYVVVMRHRNHLSAASGSAVSLTASPGATGAPYDVSFATPLRAADANADGEVRNDDKNVWWYPMLGQSGYLPGDFNLDGQVNAADRDVLWRRNVGLGTSSELN